MQLLSTARHADMHLVTTLVGAFAQQGPGHSLCPVSHCRACQTLVAITRGSPLPVSSAYSGAVKQLHLSTFGT